MGCYLHFYIRDFNFLVAVYLVPSMAILIALARLSLSSFPLQGHDNVIKWKHFPRYCVELTGHQWIPRTKANDAELWCFLWSPPEINGWVNNRQVGDLRRHRAHYDVIVEVQILPGKLHQPVSCQFRDYPR